MEEKLKIWRNYVDELFEDERREPFVYGEFVNVHEDEDLDITKEEITYALKNMKNDKAPGPDEIPAEILKLIEEDTTHTLVELFNLIYKSGTIPRE